MLASLVLALGGCAEPSSDDAARSPSDASLRTSGPLADGFMIEPGSALIGAVFPFSAGEGLQVLLRVDGDLPAVFAGYVRQAEQLGYPLEPQMGPYPQELWCSDPDDGITDDASAEGPFEVECAAYGVEVDHWHMSLRGVADRDGRGYLRLTGGRYSENSAPSVSNGPTASVTDVELAPDVVPSTVDPPLRVVEGSELLFDPLPWGCNTGSYVAMLRVTGDLESVMRAYREQFTDAGFPSEALVGNEDGLYFWGGLAGGGDMSAVGAGRDPSYVLIERCNSN